MPLVYVGIGMPRTETALEDFKSILRTHQPIDVVRRKIISGHCEELSDEKYGDLRQVVAERYEVHTNNVLVVGSAKLGFSIAPHKRYRLFNDESDVDLVIVSEKLFEVVWKSIYDFERYGGDWQNKDRCKKYIFKGWIRPDMIPPAPRFEFCRGWKDFFRELSGSDKFGEYKISGALYHSWHFIETYQESSVALCKEIAEEIL